MIGEHVRGCVQQVLSNGEDLKDLCWNKLTVEVTQALERVKCQKIDVYHTNGGTSQHHSAHYSQPNQPCLEHLLQHCCNTTCKTLRNFT